MILVLFCTLYAQNIDKKIKTTKTTLNTNLKKERILKQNLYQLQKKIKTYENTLKNIRSQMAILKVDIDSYKQKSKISAKKLNKTKQVLKTLQNSRDKVNKKIVKLLTKEIYLNILLSNSLEITSKENFIKSYIYKAYAKVIKEKFNKTKVKYFKLKVELAVTTKELDALSKKIASLEEKKQKLNKLRQTKKQGLKELDLLKKGYNKKN